VGGTDLVIAKNNNLTPTVKMKARTRNHYRD